MTIGFDIDDTITNTTEELNAYIKTLDEFKGILDYRDANFVRLVKYINPIMANLSIFANVVDVLNYFKNKGYKIVFITARGAGPGKPIIPITNKYLKDNKIPYNKVVYGQEVKGQACIDNNIDIFIDDTESVLDEITSKNIKTLRFSRKECVSKYDVVHNWLEIKDYIDRWVMENGR